MTGKLKQKIYNLLKQDDRLWNEEKTELNQTLLLDLVDKIDEKIIGLLLQEKDMIEKFFVKIKDVYVFKTNDFKFFMEENKIDNSYTQYKGRIGLSDGKRFLKESGEVVLNFPYKDCILVGGQTKEEGLDTFFEYEEEKTKTINDEKVIESAGYKEKQAKRKEIFFNQVLAKDEIDRLFDEKALVNWKRVSKDGEQEVKEIKRNRDSIIKENLIIKGNNLLALNSLRKQFAGNVKLIYIDPPYNTEGDTFVYNDSFSHSTWLTFIKNRLDVSKELLRNDGVIFINIGDDEAHYLKVLADEVFGRENYLNTVARVSKTASNKGTHFAPSIDFVLCYAKNKLLLPGFYDDVNENLYKKIETEGERKGEKYRDDIALYQSSLDPMRGCKNQRYFIEAPDGTLLIPPGGSFPKEKMDYAYITPKNGNDKIWRWTFGTCKKNKDLLVFKRTKTSPLLDEGGNKAKWNIYTKSYLLDRRKAGIKPRNYFDQFINRKGADYIKKLGIDFNYSKPVELIEYLIKIVRTNKNDIILDFFSGSGTTGEAVFRINNKDKGNRKFILIEQLEYSENITVKRIKKIIELENSEDSFIYFELAKWNEKAKEEILACNSLNKLEILFDSLCEKYFLNYNLKIKVFKEKVIKEENFRDLSLEEQKKIFLSMIDLNQMYIHKTEMADKKFGISHNDQQLTNDFYNYEN